MARTFSDEADVGSLKFELEALQWQVKDLRRQLDGQEQASARQSRRLLRQELKMMGLTPGLMSFTGGLVTLGLAAAIEGAGLFALLVSPPLILGGLFMMTDDVKLS